METLPSIDQLFDPQHTTVPNCLHGCTYPWEILLKVSSQLSTTTRLAPSAQVHSTAIIGDGVVIGERTVIGPYVVIEGPALIGADCVIRAHSVLRPAVIMGDTVSIGHSCELKNSVLFNGVRLGHLNYVGDSVLGYQVHFGGGALTANQKSDNSAIIIKLGEQSYPTGLLKLGAMIGDCCEIGSHATLHPGTVIGRCTTVYPGALVRGLVPANSIIKVRQQQEIVVRKF